MESFLEKLDKSERERLLARLTALRESLESLYEAAQENEPISGAELEREASP